MPQYTAVVSRTVTVTLSFKARNEEAAEEKLQAMLDEGMPLDKAPKGYHFDEIEEGDFEIESIDEE